MDQSTDLQLARANLVMAYKLIILSAALLSCAQNAAAFSQAQTSSLATVFVPIYPGLTSHPEIQARTSLLIQQVICQSIILLSQSASSNMIQIKDSDVDIFCLQGLFLTDIQRQIYQSLRPTYPYIYSTVDFSAEMNLAAEMNLEKTPCTPNDLTLLEDCIEEKCPSTEKGVPMTCISLRYIILLAT